MSDKLNGRELKEHKSVVSDSTKHGHSMASSVNPLMNGTSNVGTDNGKYAREGHVHPTDTNLIPKQYISNGASVMSNLASYVTTAPSTKGICKITLPISGARSMFTMEINGHLGETSLNSPYGSWKLIIGAQPYSTGWRGANVSYIPSNNKDITVVRFANDENGKKCILLNTIDKSWAYSQIFISRVIVGYVEEESIPLEGWNISFIDSEEGLTDIKEVYINTLLSDSKSIIPRLDNAYDIGSTSLRFKEIYANTGIINTSDKNDKKDIKSLSDEQTRNFIMGLNPVSFEFKDGLRTHYGLVSQDVEELIYKLGMNSLDFAGFIRSPIVEEIETSEYTEKIIINEDGKEEVQKTPIRQQVVVGEKYGLRYEEFIAPLIKVVQQQQKEIEFLKQKTCRF